MTHNINILNMTYLTSKELRVQKAWNKKGLSGLRNYLLEKVDEKDTYDWDDDTFVRYVASLVYALLPAKNWKHAEQYIRETCGLCDIDIDEGGFESLIMTIRLNEETMREDIGDD